MIDLKQLSPYQLSQLIKDAKVELELRDKITKIQMKTDPKPKYIKPGTTGKGLNKKEKDTQTELEKLNAQIEKAQAEIARLSAKK